MYKETIKELTLRMWWWLLRRKFVRMLKEAGKVITLILIGILKFILMPIVRGIYFAVSWVWRKILATIDGNPRACVGVLILALTLACVALFANGRAKEETLNHKVDSLKYVNDNLRVLIER